MLNYISHRLMIMVPTLMAISAIVFIIIQLPPGDYLTTMIEELKSVPLAQGHDEVFYPGEIEARNDVKNRQRGLILPEDTISDLAAAATEMKVSLSLHD